MTLNSEQLSENNAVVNSNGGIPLNVQLCFLKWKTLLGLLPERGKFYF